MELLKSPATVRLSSSYETILQYMIADGLLSAETAAHIESQVVSSNVHILELVERLGIKNQRAPQLPFKLDGLIVWLAGRANKQYFEIDPLKIDFDCVAHVLPTAYARRLQVIPVKAEGGSITVATANPFALSWIPEIERVTGKKIEIVVASPSAISHLIEEVYTVRTATRDFRIQNPKSNSAQDHILELEKMLGKAKGNDLGQNGPAVIRIVDWLFQFANDERATDIHLEPKRGKGAIRFRIDGQMRNVYTFEPALMLPVISRIKIISEMLVDERRKPQDGHIRYRLRNGRELEMRLSTIPVQHGEKLVVRIFDPKMAASNFQTLGFAPADIKIWERLIELPHGLVLVTGPTGSGKSTTLHTSMRRIARENVNICTIEDPIEIVNDDLNQVQTNAKLGITFGEAIRSFLRQDPDVIMVGEIRDLDAGKMAIQAALTGHLVLSTLHTNDAISSITRLIDLGIPSHLITASLRGMLAQRLVRRLCEHCKVKHPTPQDRWNEMLGGNFFAMPEYVFSPVGCKDCKYTGYVGRLCVYEIVLMTPELKKYIHKTVTIEELMAAAKNDFTPLIVNGAQKVAEGLTSMEEVTRVVF